MALVLVVEDDADLSQLIARRLQSYGHKVVTAPSARLAISLVGLDFPAQIAVLDVNLPGMNGFDLLEELRRHPELDNPKLPAIFLTGAATPEDQERSKELGAAYLTKPFVSGELQGTILHMLKDALGVEED